jgi:hypothetical protein
MSTYIPQSKIISDVLSLEHKDFTPQDHVTGDHYAHAPGRICSKCDREIAAGQPARRRGDFSWVHDVCPEC